MPPLTPDLIKPSQQQLKRQDKIAKLREEQEALEREFARRRREQQEALEALARENREEEKRRLRRTDHVLGKLIRLNPDLIGGAEALLALVDANVTNRLDRELFGLAPRADDPDGTSGPKAAASTGEGRTGTDDENDEGADEEESGDESEEEAVAAAPRATARR